MVKLKTQLHQIEIKDKEERVKLAETQRDNELKRLIRKKLELNPQTNPSLWSFLKSVNNVYFLNLKSGDKVFKT